MTGKQIIEQFNLDYGQDISLDVFGLEPSEVLLFLNQAVDDVVHDIYVNKNYELLSNITERSTSFNKISMLTGIPNSIVFEDANIGTNFLFYIKSASFITKSFPSTTNYWSPNDLISIVDSRYVQTAYNKPMFQNCKVMKIKSGTKLAFMVIHDSYTPTITSFTLDYIRKPAKIVDTTVEYELDASLHPIIIKNAVTIAIEVMQAERVKTQPIIDK